MHALIHDFIGWYLRSLETGGYPLIVLLMAVESSVVPLPSELIIPPAAYLAHTQGNMTLLGIALAGAFGSWLGATAMYWAARLAGRPLILRFGKFVLITPDKVEKAERWSERFGPFGVFASRLLPVVRHLIGLPAGIVRLPYGLYSLYTLVGSGLWCFVLCWVGLQAGKDEALMRGELHEITLWVAGALAVLGAIYYFFVHRQMQAEKK
ncbi:MAG: DedA family protein [Opitutaceae bacterium]|jgi:membrane protein DedA with SNARE-associated domain